jgi:hypothetical protein
MKYFTLYVLVTSNIITSGMIGMGLHFLSFFFDLGHNSIVIILLQIIVFGWMSLGTWFLNKKLILKLKD